MHLQQCEDLEDSASLAHMYRIVKTIIMLNEASLLEEILKEVSHGGCQVDTAGMSRVQRGYV